MSIYYVINLGSNSQLHHKHIILGTILTFNNLEIMFLRKGFLWDYLHTGTVIIGTRMFK